MPLTSQGKAAMLIEDLCEKLLLDHREFLDSLAPARFQEAYQELLCQTLVIVKIFTSTDEVYVYEAKGPWIEIGV